MKLVFIVTYLCVLGLSMAKPNLNLQKVIFENKNSTLEMTITFETFTPRGLRISVPKLNGMDLFSFDGKINQPIRKRDPGNLPWEIILPVNNRLVKEFPDVQLATGDTINYWVRIQHNGVSLQSESLAHVVKELQPSPFSGDGLQNSASEEIIESRTTPMPWPVSQQYSSPPLVTSRIEPQQSNKDQNCCSNSLRAVLAQSKLSMDKIRTLEEKVLPLEEQLSNLKEAVEELVRFSNTGTKLLLTGNLPARTNPVEDVRLLLIEKLKLQDLSGSILQAEYTSNGIAFEMSSSIAKLRILKRSRELLANLSYQIIDDVQIDIRSSK